MNIAFIFCRIHYLRNAIQCYESEETNYVVRIYLIMLLNEFDILFAIQIFPKIPKSNIISDMLLTLDDNPDYVSDIAPMMKILIADRKSKYQKYFEELDSRYHSQIKRIILSILKPKFKKIVDRYRKDRTNSSGRKY